MSPAWAVFAMGLGFLFGIAGFFGSESALGKFKWFWIILTVAAVLWIALFVCLMIWGVIWGLYGFVY